MVQLPSDTSKYHLLLIDDHPIVLAGIRGMSLEETALLAQKAGAVTCCSESANAPELAEILTQIHFDG